MNKKNKTNISLKFIKENYSYYFVIFRYEIKGKIPPKFVALWGLDCFPELTVF